MKADNPSDENRILLESIRKARKHTPERIYSALRAGDFNALHCVHDHQTKLELLNMAERDSDTDAILAVVSHIHKSAPKLLRAVLMQHPIAMRLWAVHVRSLEGDGYDSASWTASRAVYRQAQDEKNSALALLRLAFAVREV